MNNAFKIHASAIIADIPGSLGARAPSATSSERDFQPCTAIKRGVIGTQDAYDSVSVKKMCRDNVMDGNSVYIEVKKGILRSGGPGVLRFDSSSKTLVDIGTLIRLPDYFNIPYKMDVSVAPNPETGLISQETITIARDGTAGVIQCGFSQNGQFLSCHSAQPSPSFPSNSNPDLGTVNDIHCIAGGMFCSIAGSKGFFLLDNSNGSDLFIHQISFASCAVPEECAGPYLSATMLLVPASSSPSSPCEIQLATSVKDHMLRTEFTLSKVVCATLDERINALSSPSTSSPSSPSASSSPAPSPLSVRLIEPQWRVEWTRIYRQGDDFEDVKLMRYAPDGSLFFAMKDAVYRQASSRSPSNPYAVQRISSNEGLPYNNSQALSVPKYMAPPVARLYTATTAYVGTSRGVVAIEDPHHVADNLSMRIKPNTAPLSKVDDDALRTFRYFHGPRWQPAMGFSQDNDGTSLHICPIYVSSNLYHFL